MKLKEDPSGLNLVKGKFLHLEFSTRSVLSVYKNLSQIDYFTAKQCSFSTQLYKKKNRNQEYLRESSEEFLWDFPGDIPERLLGKQNSGEGFGEILAKILR